MKAQMGPRRCQGPAATAAPEPSRVEGKQRRNRFHKVLINWDFFIMLQLRSRVNGECSEKEKISGIKGQNGQTRRRPATATQISTGYCRRESLNAPRVQHIHSPTGLLELAKAA